MRGMSDAERSSADPKVRGALRWRLAVGGFVLVFGFSCPLFIPLVVSSGLSDEVKAAASGFLFFGVPELFTLAAVALMGKEGFNFFKQRAWAALRKVSPPTGVSLLRYRVGLIGFIVPLVLAWGLPYVEDFIPVYGRNRIAVAAAGDILLLVSLLILGGDFWDKLRSLFIHGAVVSFPRRQSDGADVGLNASREL